MKNKEHRMNSIHRSLRELLKLGLQRSESAEPQSITRTVKFKIDTRNHPELAATLNQHFDAFEQFRRTVLYELETWWNRNGADFMVAMQCSGKKPYSGKSTAFGVLSNRFVTGKELPAGLSNKAAQALVDSLGGNMKSFLSRRESITEEIYKRYQQNQSDWQSELTPLASDLRESLPSAPPTLDFENLTAEAIEHYNDWVGRTRAWCNLILVQKRRLSRDEAFLPRYLKGYPGFPGSQRYATAAQIEAALKSLESVARQRKAELAGRFASLQPDLWAVVVERFAPSAPDDDEKKKRPRTAHQTTCRRFAALQATHPDWSPVQFAEELVAGIFRAAEKLKKHLSAQGYEDHRAIIKLANLYNVASVFALDPLRASADYAGYYDTDTPRRKAFADLRGALHQPSDDSAAIQITGFSVDEDGSPNYNGLLICRKNAAEKDEWAFLYCHREGQTFQLASEEPKLRSKKLTEWTGFASHGGSRQKAKASAKQLVRGCVWVGEKTPPTILPLAFGARQGQQYLWHFDRDLRTKNDWVLGNGRLLRIMPPGNYERAEFYLTITLERQAPPPATVTTKCLIGVDRGEAVPAAFAVIDNDGRLLATGCIAGEYREQQRKFNDRKRELQRTKGGYTRWLRAKERNRARALGGQVSRELLALAAEHHAPLVLENLGSALATRGGKGTMMSQMQYERMLSTLEQRLTEVGLYQLPNKPKYRKRNNGFIKLVGPAYTSRTCSACGHVHSSEFYESVADTLAPASNGHWQVTVNGQARALPATYTYWLRGKGERTGNTHERITELLKDRHVSKLSKTDRKALVSLLRNRWVPYRPTQAEFQCVVCEHKMNADIQGALNIARKFLFVAERGKKAGEATEAERRKIMGEWRAWYCQKLQTVWKTA